jgi:hypothetical protein
VNEADIANALGQRLAAAPSLGTIAWPNDGTTPTAPYLVFDHVPVSRVDRTLAGGGEIAEGYVMIGVVAALNEFATPANVIADAIAARFPYALRLSFTGGTIVITQPPVILRGYPDDANWRVPVRINYRAS